MPSRTLLNLNALPVWAVPAGAFRDCATTATMPSMTITASASRRRRIESPNQKSSRELVCCGLYAPRRVQCRRQFVCMSRPNPIPLAPAEASPRRRGVSNPLGERADHVLPPFERWQLRRNTDEAANLPTPVSGEAHVFASPCFTARRNVAYAFEITFTSAGEGGTTVGFRDKWNRWSQLFENPRAVVGEGTFRIIVPLRVTHNTKVSLCVVTRQPVVGLQVSVYARRRQPVHDEPVETSLPHWNWRQRTLHRLCKRSRLLKSIV